MPDAAYLEPPDDEGSVSLESAVDLYDHERMAIRDKVVPALEANRGARRTIDGFVREIKNRFSQDAGLVVEVTVWENEEMNKDRAHSDRLYGFKIYIEARVHEESEFDHERMSHEVRSDMLGLRGEDDRTQKKVSMNSPQSSGLWTPGQT